MTQLQRILESPFHNAQPNENLHNEVLGLWRDHLRILTLVTAQAEILADKLAEFGELRTAQNAYTRILSVYKRYYVLQLPAFDQIESLSLKAANSFWDTEEAFRAETIIWQALESRPYPRKALVKDLCFLTSLARSLTKTCRNVSTCIHPTFNGEIPPHFATPCPPLELLMCSPYAWFVEGSPFHRGPFPESSGELDSPILGGLEGIV